MREGRAMLQEMGIRPFEPFFGALLAELEASTGRIEAGLSTLDSQLEVIERTVQHWSDAEVHRIRGELFVKRQPVDFEAAECAFNKSVEIARLQQVRTFELRAALSLAMLYQATGRDLAVNDLLAPALVGFVEGSELPEVERANHLLSANAKSVRAALD
jgi:predicted ATPase